MLWNLLYSSPMSETTQNSKSPELNRSSVGQVTDMCALQDCLAPDFTDQLLYLLKLSHTQVGWPEIVVGMKG